MKRFTLVGFFALVCLGSYAHAFGFSCTATGTTTPVGTAGAQYLGGPADPNWSSYTLNTGNYCASNPPYSSDPTANRTSFLSTPGQSLLDTINWEVNPTTQSPYVCSPQSLYCNNPAFADNEQGYGGYPGTYFPSPPYGGGANGTGYTWGSAPTNNSDNPLSLGLTNTFGSQPTFPYANMLTGTLSGGNDLALTYDTFTTSATYNYGGTGQYSETCTNEDIGYPSDPYCWIPGPQSNAPISGLGFDIQLQNFGQTLGPFSVTFNVYGATPGCAADGDSIVTSSGAGSGLFDCFDYTNNEMADANADDQANDGGPTCSGDGDSSCVYYNGPTSQLLGTITVNSDLLGDPAFVGFTTTDPYGIGALVMTGFSDPSAESADVNFSIDEVTLLTPSPVTTPEPATLLLFGSGLLIAARRLRKRATK